MTITQEDVKAMRQADSITFHAIKGEGFIRAHLRRYSSTPAVYSVAEQRLFPITDRYSSDRMREIPVAVHVSGYTDGEDGASRWYGDDKSSAFEMIHSSKYDDVWRTVSGLLRVDDNLEVRFIGDGGSNGLTKEAGLHADELRLDVRRGKSQTRMTFLIDVSVCANNSARMVKREGELSWR